MVLSVFFSQNALQGFMEQAVGSAACVRTEPPVTRATESVHVPVGGWAQPVNSVRLGASVSKSLRICDHETTDRWIISRKILIYYNLGLILVHLAAIYNNILGSGKFLFGKGRRSKKQTDQTGRKQANDCLQMQQFLLVKAEPTTSPGFHFQISLIKQENCLKHGRLLACRVLSGLFLASLL